MALESVELFQGRNSLRFRGERRWFWIDLIFAPATVGAIGALLHTPFQIGQIGLIITLAVVYVTLARGRLLGTSVRAHERQFPELFAVVKRCSHMLGMRVPNVFLREDPFVPITAMGLGEPYAIIISSSWLRHFDAGELDFLIGCELAHIAAGHTRISSLFSASGKENPFVALAFGAWLRRTEYTADRLGLLCCRSSEAALRAIYATSFKELKGQVQHAAFIEQRHAIERDPSLAMGEWLSETPYAVNRIKELERFVTSDAYAYWVDRLDHREVRGAEAPAALKQPAYASLYLRSLAFIVDAIVVALTGAFGQAIARLTSAGPADVGATLHELEADPSTAQLGHWLAAHPGTVSSGTVPAGLIAILLYSAVMVALIGRTCGMMVFDLRVVRTDWTPGGALRAVWRYLLALASVVTVVPVLVGLVSGWWLHERLSGTRLVRGVQPSL